MVVITEAARKGVIDYSRLGLTSNPFIGTVPQKEVSFCVGREKELELISWTLRSAFSGVSTHAVIVGGYGNGKTHLLKFIASQVNTEFNEQAVAIYVNSPGENFRQLYSNLVLGLGRTYFEQLAWKYLGIVSAFGPDSILEHLTSQQVEVLKQEPAKIKEFVESGEILLSDIVHHAKDVLSRQVLLLDFATAFLHLILEEYALLAWKWLAAEDMPYEQRRNMNLSMAISNDDRALRAFLSLKAILHEVGYDTIILLIDEFEAIAGLPERYRQRVLNEIRHLIDLASTGLCIFIGCAPEVWRIIVGDYHAFLERFTEAIFLRPLELSQVYSLISDYLQGVRCEDCPRDKPRTYPFSDALIGEIHRIALGNVRNTLKLCQVSLDYGLAHECDPLTWSDVKERLEALFPSAHEETESNGN